MTLIGKIRDTNGAVRDVAVEAADYPAAYMAVETLLGDGDRLLSVRQP